MLIDQPLNKTIVDKLIINRAYREMRHHIQRANTSDRSKPNLKFIEF